MEKHEVNIVNILITNRAMDFFDMFVDIEVKSVQHLEAVLAALRPLPAVSFVERI
jgi:GTP pyrophosphokinase